MLANYDVKEDMHDTFSVQTLDMYRRFQNRLYWIMQFIYLHILMENSAEFQTRRPTQNWRFAELELWGNKYVYSIARDYE